MAVHLCNLGVRAGVVTRVGADDLGDEVVLRLSERNVDTRLVQRDAERPTGFVRVTLKDGQPSYDLRKAAWDAIEATPDALDAARQARAVVYGSLAQREPQSRAAVQALAAASPRSVFDVNLRPPFGDKDIALSCASSCWLLKLNDEEAVILADWLGVPHGGSIEVEGLASALSKRLGCHVVVTAGAHGAALQVREGPLLRHRGCKVSVADAVGAGDAFLAVLLQGMLEDEKGQNAAQLLAKACAVGAFVASRQGATPQIAWEEVEALCAASAPTEVVSR